MEPGRAIALMRRELNLTQDQFAVVLGVSRRTVARWEVGTVPRHGSAVLLLALVRAVETAEPRELVRLFDGSTSAGWVRVWGRAAGAADSTGRDDHSTLGRLRRRLSQLVDEHDPSAPTLQRWPEPRQQAA